MEPRNKRRSAQQDETEAPIIEQQDWDAIEGNKVLPDSVVVENGAADTRETEGTLPEEEDNTYQNSDEALPGDDEEAVRVIPQRKAADSTKSN